MFVGHYGPSFAIKASRPAIPLYVLFIAVQLLDVGLPIFVLLGIEKVRIVLGITASNPLVTPTSKQLPLRLRNLLIPFYVGNKGVPVRPV